MLSSLRTRLFLFVALIVSAALILIALSANEQRGRDAAVAGEEALRLARFATSTLEQRVAAARQLLMALGRLPMVRAHDTAACDAYFADLLTQYPEYGYLGAVGLNGTDYYCSAPKTPSSVDISDRTYFQRVLNTEGFVVGDYIVGRVTGQRQVPFALPLYDDGGTLDGVLVVSTSLEWLNQWIGRIDLPQNAVMTFTDINGTILATYPTDDARIGQSLGALFPRVVAAGEGTFDADGADGVARIYGVSPFNVQAAPPDFADRGGFYIVVGIDRAAALAQGDLLYARLMIAVLIGAAVVLIAGMVGAQRWIVQPLEQIAAAAARLMHGDWSARAHLRHGLAELNTLGASIDRMAESLEQRETEMRDLVRVLTTEIEARRAAQTADEQKLRFLAMVSHELRTPLTSIKGFASTLLARDVRWDATHQDSFLHIIDEEADVLLEMVEQLLDMAQIETGAFRLHPEQITLQEIIAGIQPRLAALTTRHRFTQHVPAEPIWVEADSRRIRQVLANLVSNASKYAPDETWITLHVTCDDTHVQVSLSDEGIGIPPEQQANVFKAYNQVNSNALKKGAGIGLAICKGIVEAHGGRIWLVSSSAQGSTFAFALPLAERTTPHSKPVEVVQR